MASRPVPVAYPQAVTWTGAGLRAKISSRPLAECPPRSTRMSIWSARICSATAASVQPVTSRQTEHALLEAWRSARRASSTLA